MPIGVGTAIAGAGALGAGASILGSMNAADAQTSAANKASNTQLQIADQNNQLQQARYNQTRADLTPYNQLGTHANDTLYNQLASFLQPIKMDQATLEQTPGYQFNLSQGLKAVQNSAAARGLGVSGAAQKGAANYATGLADSTYQNQFNNANTNVSNAYNRLMGAIGIGENAAAQTGNIGQQSANAITGSNTAAANAVGNAQIGAGNAQAAGYNALGAGIGNGANSLATGLAYNNLAGGPNGLYGGSTGTGW